MRKWLLTLTCGIFLVIATGATGAATAVADNGASSQPSQGSGGGNIWDNIQEMFSFGTPITPSVDTDPLAQEVWIDGDFVRYQLGFYVQQWAGGRFQKALDLLQGVKLTRNPKQLKIVIYFNDTFQLDLDDPKKAHSFEIYRIHLPKTIRANLVVSDGSLYVSGLAEKQGDPADRIFTEVKVPIISDRVYLRRVQFELDSGLARLEAGVLGNSLGLIGNANLFEDEIKPKFEIWNSVGDNFGLIHWPKLSTTHEKRPVRNSSSEGSDGTPLN